jgi:RNA polymerase sigma factor (sigma-70 family)
MDSYVEIISRAQAAEPDEKRRLFDALAAHFQPVALTWARHVLPDDHSAEDAVQEALLIAYQQLGALRDPAAFPGWFKRIVLSQCARLRRRRSGQPLEDEWLTDEAGDDPANQVDVRWIEAELWNAVDTLSVPERTVTQLYYRDDYSQQEIATLLQVPLTTVKKRLQYAREHLRERMPVMSALTLSMPGDGAMLLLDDSIWNEWTLGYAAVFVIDEAEAVA